MRSTETRRQTKAQKLYQLTQVPPASKHVSQSVSPLLPVSLCAGSRRWHGCIGLAWGGPREAAWNWDTARRGPKALRLLGTCTFFFLSVDAVSTNVLLLRRRRRGEARYDMTCCSVPSLLHAVRWGGQFMLQQHPAAYTRIMAQAGCTKEGVPVDQRLMYLPFASHTALASAVYRLDTGTLWNRQVDSHLLPCLCAVFVHGRLVLCQLVPVVDSLRDARRKRKMTVGV
jgi:hypothetical protein